jgi:hypothetical protein
VKSPAQDRTEHHRLPLALRRDLRSALFALPLLLALAPGCADQPVAPVWMCGNQPAALSGDVAGTWAAPLSVGGGFGLYVRLTLAQQGTCVTGTGSYSVVVIVNPTSGSIGVAGTYVRPHLSLTLTYQYGDTTLYVAVLVDSSHIAGQEYFADGRTAGLTLARQ